MSLSVTYTFSGGTQVNPTRLNTNFNDVVTFINGLFLNSTLTPTSGDFFLADGVSWNSYAPADAAIGVKTALQTWSNKTVTSPTVTGASCTSSVMTSPVINTSIAGTAFKDEDNMASNSDTAIVSQQSFKNYTDSTVSGRNMKYKSGTYTGDGGTSHALTGVGFKPTYLKIYNHLTSEAAGTIFEKVGTGWGVYSYLYDSTPYTSTYDHRVLSLDADGFTVDDDSADLHPNKSGQVYDFLAKGEATQQNTALDFDAADESLFTQFDCKQTAAYFQCDTANTSGHFEDSGNTAVTIGSGQTCPYIQVGTRFYCNSIIFEITAISGTGSADNAVTFKKQDGTAPTLAANTYALSWVRGTEFLSTGVAALNKIYTTTAVASWTGVVDSDESANEAGVSFRQVVSATQLSQSGDYVRVSFQACASTYKFQCDHVSIVEQSSGANGTTTPTEILFSGASGFNISAGNAITSDWLLYAIDETKAYIVIYDMNATGDNRYRHKADAATTNYYKTGAASYNSQTVTGYSSAAYNQGLFKLEVLQAQYPITTIYPITTNTNQINTTLWDDINSMTVSETLSSQKIHYAVSFDNRVTWKVNTTGAFRSVARLNGATWEYNSNSTYGSETWASATINSQEGALAQAFGVSANQMTGTQLNAVTDDNWNASGGFTTSVNTLDMAFGLVSTSATATPTITLVTIDYTR
jgi:hypothetical protein